jgi:hypothetical protein
MSNERNPRTQPPRPRRGEAPPEWQRIPLPPLPRFRRVTPGAQEPPADPVKPMTQDAPGISSAESDFLQGGDDALTDSLLPPGPRHEGPANPALDVPPEERTGVIGAAVINDLVDEIERDLVRDLNQHYPESSLPEYRRALTCSFRSPDPTGRNGR